ncbi:MAG: hypothetical protein O2905_00785 [Proteobacteria bacterium]|nr:hypothetical protein [Pseudomonadota bacterium]
MIKSRIHGFRRAFPRINGSHVFAILIAAAGIAAGLGPAAATEAQTAFDAGMRAARGGQFDAAREAWAPLAEAGHAPSQYNLGLMHARGAGVPRDMAAAYALYVAAAEQDHSLAQYAVGMALQRGDGVAADAAAAFAWFARAAEGRVAAAAFELGTALHEGDGVAVDLPLALQWFWVAARLGYADAIPARNFTERELTADQAVAAEAAATAWLLAHPAPAR